MTNEDLNRGFFDPISLGIYLQFDYSEYKSKGKFVDTEKIEAFGSFAHEFSHYLQFYGTTFGLFYLMMLTEITEVTKKIIFGLEKHHSNLSTPLLKYIPSPNVAAKISQVDEDRLTMALLGGRFFQEEFFGWTYPHLGISPIFIKNRPYVTSPVHLSLFEEKSPLRYLPITGKVLFETQACYNETSYIARCSPNNDYYYESFKKNYLNLPSHIRDEYLGLSQWIIGQNLGKIEPIIYFVLLNQNPQGWLNKVGDYNLIKNLKTLLLKSSSLTDINEPNNETELINAIELICNKTELDNPFTALETNYKLIEKNISENNYSIERLISVIFKWQLENKYYAVYWYKNPSLIWNSLPIINLHTTNLNNHQLSLFPNLTNKAELKKAIGFTNSLIPELNEIYLINSIYNNQITKCPYYFHKKPSICKSCTNCSGYLPDKTIKDDCPVMKKWKEIGFNKFPN